MKNKHSSPNAGLANLLTCACQIFPKNIVPDHDVPTKNKFIGSKNNASKINFKANIVKKYS